MLTRKEDVLVLGAVTVRRRVGHACFTASGGRSLGWRRGRDDGRSSAGKKHAVRKRHCASKWEAAWRQKSGGEEAGWRGEPGEEVGGVGDEKGGREGGECRGQGVGGKRTRQQTTKTDKRSGCTQVGVSGLAARQMQAQRRVTPVQIPSEACWRRLWLPR